MTDDIVTEAATPSVIVSAEELARRVIAPSQFVADTKAFVDVRLPRSAGKASYSMIGPGVSQNADQTINLVAPHGFNLGAATMPHGVVNNQHLHYTAEVFICTSGAWRFAVGERAEQKLDVKVGDVFSAPTWVFRGFENIGDDDGFLFVALGGDDTGGIIWAPWVLTEAARTGFYLGTDYAVIDASDGPPPDNVVEPLAAAELEAVDHYDDDELARRLVTQNDLDWSERALLSSVVPGHRCSVAPVIGFGLSQDRNHRPAIWDPHGFSIEWLRVSPGSSVGRHRHDQSQVVILTEGDWRLSVNRGPDELQVTPDQGSVLSIPADSWRDYTNVGTEEALAVVVTGGDEPTRIDWDDDLVAAAREHGWAVDASGKLAPLSLLARADH